MALRRSSLRWKRRPGSTARKRRAVWLLAEPGLGDSDSLHLFYTREESEEIY